MWAEINVVGSPPPERGGHAGCSVGGNLCVFVGGANRTPSAYNDVVVLEASTPTRYEWKTVAVTVAGGAELPPRSGATATAVGSKVYVFGGQDPETGICFNDVIVLDTETWEWSRTTPEGGAPPPRHSHAAGLHGGRVVVVFGGAGQEGPLGDVWTFDTEVCKWDRPKVKGQSPDPREMHSGTVLGGGGRMLIYGGRGTAGVLSDAYILDLSEFKWKSLGHTALPRCAHASALLTRSAALAGEAPEGGEEGGGEVVAFFGGFSGGEVADDVLLLDPAALSKPVPTKGGGKGPGARFACAGCALGGGAALGLGGARMVVFGGVSAEKDLNDVAVWGSIKAEDEGSAPVEPKVADDLD